MMIIPNSELILNKDGSVYHLTLLPEDIADTIISVGDPERVPKITQYFDSIEVQKINREFRTETGYFKGKRITVIATGIGTDNIDIVLNELDALANVDLKTRTVKPQLKSLNIIRIGTSGTLQDDIPIDSFLVSAYAIGLDGLIHFYKFKNADDNINQQVENIVQIPSYTSKADDSLLTHLAKDIRQGITLTAAGFYAPQGRQIRLDLKVPNFIDKLSAQQFDNGLQLTNLEMETAGIYALGSLLGHRCISFNAILANRKLGLFSNQADKTIDSLIQLILQRISEL